MAALRRVTIGGHGWGVTARQPGVGGTFSMADKQHVPPTRMDLHFDNLCIWGGVWVLATTTGPKLPLLQQTCFSPSSMTGVGRSAQA